MSGAALDWPRLLDLALPVLRSRGPAAMEGAVVPLGSFAGLLPTVLDRAAAIVAAATPSSS